MGHTTGRFTGAGGLELYYQSWRPEQPILAVVGIIHGLGGHSGLFGTLVERLVATGYGVYALDLRGHGLSPGQRGYINQWDEFYGDVSSFHQLMAGENPDLPCFLAGHSLGAVIMLDYAVRCSAPLAGVVAMSPVIGPVGISRLKLGIGRVCSRVWPRFTLDAGIPDDAGSRDPTITAAYLADPLRHTQGTARLVTEFFRVIRRLRQQLPQFPTPILIIQGSDDPVALPEGSRYLFRQLQIEDKAYFEYPGGLHDLHNDICAKQVATDVTNWIHQHVSDQAFLCSLQSCPIEP